MGLCERKGMKREREMAERQSVRLLVGQRRRRRGARFFLVLAPDLLLETARDW